MQSGVPDLKALAAFCRLAERCGIETVLTAFGFHRPDPIVLATALGMMTERITFLVAVRSGLGSPTAFVQQVNSVAAVTGGRIALNVVAGHTPDEQRGYGDFLAHDERYARTDEFLSVCRSLWTADGPVSFEGKYYQDPERSAEYAVRIRRGRARKFFLEVTRPRPPTWPRHASCLLRLPKAPIRMKPEVERLTAHGTDVRTSCFATGAANTRGSNCSDRDHARTSGLTPEADARCFSPEVRFCRFHVDARPRRNKRLALAHPLPLDWGCALLGGAVGGDCWVAR